MGSNPVVKERLQRMMEGKRHIEAESVEELKNGVDMSDVSNTQFRRALESLHYNPGPVHVNRPHMGHMAARPYHVTYVAVAS